MELHDTVTLLCTETFSDVFTPYTAFKGKLNPFAEVSNSGAASQRRILETDPNVFLPSSRVVISPASEIFIVADVNIDFWNGAAIRYKYPVLPVSEVIGAVGSIGQTLSHTQSDKAVYAYPYFVRRESDEAEMSDFLSGYEISFSKTKTFYRSQILTLGSKYYRLKTDSWVDGAGFSVAQAILLEAPVVQTLSVTTKGSVYDPSTDSYTSNTPVNVLCFMEPLGEDYEFVSPSFESIEPGDKAISLLSTAATIQVNDVIGNYKVLSVRNLGTWYTCHGRNING